MATSITVDTAIWIVNFIIIYFWIYKRGYRFISGAFMFLNCLLAFKLLESEITRLTIFVGIIISIMVMFSTLMKLQKGENPT